jgi:hypothetical protein
MLTQAKDFIHLCFGTDCVGPLFVYLFSTHTIDEVQDACGCHKLSESPHNKSLDIPSKCDLISCSPILRIVVKQGLIDELVHILLQME